VRFVSSGCSPAHVIDAAFGDRFIVWRRHGMAQRMLTALMNNGGFIAGGYARAVVLEASGMLRHAKTFVPEDQYGDIDVFFEREVTLPELKDMVRDCEIDDTHCSQPSGQPPRPCWHDNTVDYPDAGVVKQRSVGCFYVTFPDQQMKLVKMIAAPFDDPVDRFTAATANTVKINVITFKHGSPEKLLNDFDVTPCQVAFNRDGETLVRSDFARVEREGLVSVNWEMLRTRSFDQLHLPKTVERLAKYVQRIAISAGAARVLPGELAKIVRITQADDLKRLQRMSWDTQRTLASAATAEDCITFAMMVWPQMYLQTKMFERLYGRS